MVLPNFPAAHEIGHWLNLRHIWGDDGDGCSGDDFVVDTPNQGGSNFGTLADIKSYTGIIEVISLWARESVCAVKKIELAADLCTI